MTGTHPRRPAPDRARKRAIRALAAELGVAYSVAARLLTSRSGGTVARRRQRFPTGGGEHRAWMFATREQRSFHSRVLDTRTAADLPIGRAAHLVRRFPPLAVASGRLYDGNGREAALAMLYAVVAHESTVPLPTADELAWVAELGEETAVDVTCAALDRAARALLDDDERWRLWPRVEAALAALGEAADRRGRDAALTLGRELRSTSLRSALVGVRHILDAVLVEPFDGSPPGARIRLDGRDGTVLGARWARTGPPVGYEVRLDGGNAVRIVSRDDLDLTPV
ncbi:hypothetical protein Val02_83510 [Virgisporangium aliadipatigenens]|uniref:Uncharacterized protein n=1 Tax=Virgisporangium aliadipatigenens TaxID=741659 RepID=A0A8J3YX78_9ACTN|nr:hypothetical protein [Virgisporangium aliadipatigenens]GIJ51465.1 hypothetical protein Val02_83510 [Virgisporangium aliadipatigenens]